jgi:hypothetical protein
MKTTSNPSRQVRYSFSISLTLWLTQPLPRLVPEFPYMPYDGIPPGYPSLDFKPTPLQNWYLVAILTFFLSCLGSISAIVFLDHRSPATLHLRAQRNFLVLRYLPGIIGTITTILWRSTSAALFHMTPYITMSDAKMLSSASKDQ